MKTGKIIDIFFQRVIQSDIVWSSCRILDHYENTHSKYYLLCHCKFSGNISFIKNIKS